MFKMRSKSRFLVLPLIMLQLLISTAISFALDINFGSPEAYSTGSRTTSVTAGDFNGDDKPDIAASRYFGDSYGYASIFIGNGNGTFQTRHDYYVEPYLSSITNGDFNRDGIQDIATVNDWLHTLSVLTGNGDGTFQNRTDYDVGYMWSAIMSITSGDFNGDGKTDIAAASYWYSSVLLFINTGDGNFQRWQINDVGLNPISISAGDINGDGKIDIALTNDNQNSVSIVIGNGDGTFQPKREYNVGFNPSAVTLADIDGDGKIDLALTKYNQNTVVILTGNSDGTFELAGEFNSGPLPVSIIAGDFNGDHKIDLAVANWDAGTISVLINNHPPLANAGPDQIIECPNPSGASVTLNGSASSDPDGDPIILKWTWPGGSTEGVNPTVQLPLGTTVVTLTVSDGQATVTDTVNIIVQDTISPVTIATGGSNNWFNTSVISTFTASDNGSGVKEIHYIIDGSKTVASGNYASVTIATEGNHNITYFASDNAGNAETPKGLTVMIDKTAPTGSVIINNNAVLTNSISVTLTLSANDNLSGVSQMRFSNDNVNWSAWETYSSTRSWTLLNVMDVMTVYAQFRDGAGNVSGVYSDDIYIDTDNDGWRDSQDCAPADWSINPSATETVGNSIDENCNGITVTSLTYDPIAKRLTVEATSTLGQSANLQLNSVNMTWNAGQSLWSKTLTNVTSHSATVSGSQGTDTISY